MIATTFTPSSVRSVRLLWDDTNESRKAVKLLNSVGPLLDAMGVKYDTWYQKRTEDDAHLPLLLTPEGEFLGIRNIRFWLAFEQCTIVPSLDLYSAETICKDGFNNFRVVLSRMLECFNEEPDERPNPSTFKPAWNLLNLSWQQMLGTFPLGSPGTNGYGGTRISWRRREEERMFALVKNNATDPFYIFFEGGEIHGIEYMVTPQTVASWLDWLTGRLPEIPKIQKQDP